MTNHAHSRSASPRPSPARPDSGESPRPQIGANAAPSAHPHIPQYH
jgi:hypothetical protein